MFKKECSGGKIKYDISVSPKNIGKLESRIIELDLVQTELKNNNPIYVRVVAGSESTTVGTYSIRIWTLKNNIISLVGTPMIGMFIT